MAGQRLTPEEKTRLLRRRLDDGVTLTRLAEESGIPAWTLRRGAAAFARTGTGRC
jgi:transposase-like protein